MSEEEYDDDEPIGMRSILSTNKRGRPRLTDIDKKRVISDRLRIMTECDPIRLLIQMAQGEIIKTDTVRPMIATPEQRKYAIGKLVDKVMPDIKTVAVDLDANVDTEHKGEIRLIVEKRIGKSDK